MPIGKGPRFIGGVCVTVAIGKKPENVLAALLPYKDQDTRKAKSVSCVASRLNKANN